MSLVSLLAAWLVVAAPNEIPLGVFEITFYCDGNGDSDQYKKPSHPAYGITKTGTKVRWGVVAVDPRVIPLGSTVRIEGLGTFRAEDTGGKVKGRIIDVWHRSKRRCLQWGRKKRKVWLVVR